jgi:hypothetical protein
MHNAVGLAGERPCACRAKRHDGSDSTAPDGIRSGRPRSGLQPGWTYPWTNIAQGGYSTGLRCERQCLYLLGGEQATYTGPKARQLAEVARITATLCFFNCRTRGKAHLLSFVYLFASAFRGEAGRAEAPQPLDSSWGVRMSAIVPKRPYAIVIGNSTQGVFTTPEFNRIRQNKFEAIDFRDLKFRNYRIHERSPVLLMGSVSAISLVLPAKIS